MTKPSILKWDGVEESSVSCCDLALMAMSCASFIPYSRAHQDGARRLFFLPTLPISKLLSLRSPLLGKVLLWIGVSVNANQSLYAACPPTLPWDQADLMLAWCCLECALLFQSQIVVGILMWEASG